MSDNETITLVTQNGPVELPGDTLLVAVDETGHEGFAPTHRVFGLGGCACLVKHYGQLIDDPWCSMKAELFGSQSVQLHAAELRSPSPEQLEGLEFFFANFQFFRFAVMVAETMQNETEHGLLKVVSRMLLDRIADMAGYALPCDVAIVVESSERIQQDVLSELSSYRMGDGERDFQPKVYTLPKSAGWPMLEVADFVMHAAGAQVRNRLANKFMIRKDFEVVFHRIDRRLSHYSELLGLRNPAKEPNMQMNTDSSAAGYQTR
jgi:hypothetical protein